MDDNIIDFTSDNYNFIVKTLKDILSHGTEIWHMIPDMLSDSFGTCFNFIYRIYMKIRSQIVLKLTQDITRLDQDKEIWYKTSMLQLDKMEILENILDNDKQKRVLKRLLYFIKNDKKTEFLKYCIENQEDSDFIKVRNELLLYVKNPLDLKIKTVTPVPNQGRVFK